MPLAVLVFALVAYGYALLAYPEFRRPGLIAGALAAAALGFYLVRQPSEAERAASRIPREEVELDAIALARTPRGATVTGRILSRSEHYRLRELGLRLRLHDCADPEADAVACPVIGEAQAIARPDVPPGQIRALSAHFTFANLPPVVGTLRWDLTVTGTRATAE
jgi:hypothetical protein